MKTIINSTSRVLKTALCFAFLLFMVASLANSHVSKAQELGRATNGCGAFRVLILTTNTSAEALVTQLQAQPGLDAAEVFTATTATPELSLLQGYDIVVTVMGLHPADPDGMGDVLASYIDGSGVVVQSTQDWYVGNLGGRWIDDLYSPLSNSTTVLTDLDYLGWYDPTSPLMRGMEDGGAFQSRVGDISATTGATIVARYQNSTTLALVAHKGRVVAINGRLTGRINTTNWTGEWSRVIMNAGNTLYNCPEATATPAPPTSTSTATTSPTATVTGTPPTATNTATATSTSMATATSTACAIQYTDVPSDSTFYSFIRCLACRSVMGGYSDGTFRPDNLITRGQIAKIVSNAANLIQDPGSQVFEDVPTDNTFYTWVNRLSNEGYMGGYPCGGEGEPCGVGNLPYFRPYANATRGQIAKIVSNAAGYSDTSGTQMFEDVPSDHTFYVWVQRLASRGIMGGYPCGGEGEPCGSGNLPYFRPGNNATRGQVSKIVSNTFYPSCQTP